MNLTKPIGNVTKLSYYLFTHSHQKIIGNWLGASYIHRTAYSYKMSKFIEIPVQAEKLLKLTRSTVVPTLNATDGVNQRHKGQAGRIGVIGGSLEYTGAPYFSAISAMRVGADLAHVFCQRDAAVVIKSYSPELIVHPLLDADDAVEQITPWMERLHVLVIGPGLGRDPKIQKTAIRLIKLCKELNKPLVIDADGLFILNENIDLVNGLCNVILTPNKVEFRRLFTEDVEVMKQRMAQLGDGVIVLEKGPHDKIYIPSTSEIYTLPAGGSGRRCGGQGDLLCGSIATFFHWALESNQANAAFVATFAACYLVKKCNAAGYQKLGRSMLASDMLNEIPSVFRNIFEDP
ncbi:ATP-dependent (S)-NAD(P)H-hydrate dehydratase [Rhagoletis pomonella]|uniref:ATP-dependent (S)-NAD(P)H-hydrate dehydratase n=1 Tax=Rhagoletis pomonella TaxID=28610 RepID=UPI00177C9475|nr:ATP-dependent (S)-NAD(P)H-hydrate dehydratase [Rhagoletis pomonella]